MKLRNYFKNQKYTLPEDQKLLIFDNIKTQITQQSIFLRVSFYSKVVVYSLILFFVFFALFVNNNKNLSPNVIVHKETIGEVYADYIGKIIQSTWDFQIFDGTKNIKTKDIFKWDILVLKNWAYLTIAVNEWIKLYVVGPAKVKLDMYKDTEGHDVYVFNMLDGDYISVKSNSAKDKIVIKSKYLNIQSDDKYIDLKYEKKWKAVIVENNGWNILVKNDKNIINLDKKEKLIVLSSKQEWYLRDLFSDSYKKYQLSDGKLKIILSSKELKKLDNILDKKMVIIATWKYVLGTLNGDKKWQQEGKFQLIYIIKSLYHFFNVDIPPLLKTKIEKNTISTADLQALLDNLLGEINKKYIIPDMYVNRLKVMLAYMVVLENIKTKRKFENLSELVNYLKLDRKYKKMMLRF
jgi:hypothetical protein